MSFFSALNIGTAKGKKDIQIRLGSHPLITIHASGLSLIVNTVPAFLEYLTSLSDNPAAGSIVQESDRVQQLITTYLRMRNEYFGRKGSSVTYKKNSPQYAHFSRALEIIDTHEVTFEYFIKAQIDGLKFLQEISGKSESFPQPGYLSTAEAETRLLKYMNKKDTKERPTVILTQKEKETPLKQNNKFLELWDMFVSPDDEKDRQITLEEAIYLEQCYVARKKSVPQKLAAYIESKL